MKLEVLLCTELGLSITSSIILKIPFLFISRCFRTTLEHRHSIDYNYVSVKTFDYQYVMILRQCMLLF